MSDTPEIKITLPGEDTPDVADKAPTYTALEQKALDMGWRPLSEYDGDEADFIDAKEFVGRKPLYDKLAAQSKELKNVKHAVTALQTHYNKVQETEYNRALSALKQERKNALSEGNGDRFDHLDEEIKIVEKQFEMAKREKAAAQQAEKQVHPEFANWQERNPWYGSTRYMREFADDVGKRLAGTMAPAEVLKKVEAAVRDEFPHKFTNANKADAPSVGSSKGGGKSKGAEFALDEQERRIMETLVRGKYITKEKYIADLKKAKGIE